MRLLDAMRQEAVLIQKKAPRKGVQDDVHDYPQNNNHCVDNPLDFHRNSRLSPSTTNG